MNPDDPRNPKKARRHDEEPPDIGRSLPPTTDPSLPGNPSSPTSPRHPMSYKDSLLGESRDKPSQGDSFVEDDDIEILDGEVTRSIVDGMISIQFSERIQALAAKSMDRTIILKLLGRRIGYETLKMKIHDLWKPASEIKLMDIENGYFLATFRSHNDFLTVLADGPWTIFGHYLTVEPWSPDFSPSQPFPSKVVAWIRLPGLSATLYKRSLIEEIVKCVRLKLLPMVNQLPLHPPHAATSAAFGPWMLVEKRQRRPARKPHNTDTQQQVEVPGGSRFNPLSTEEEEAVVTGGVPAASQADISRPRNPRVVNKGKQVVAAKQLRAVSVRKPLSTSLSDFPIMPRSSLKATNSRGSRASNPVTILDKSRHSAIMLSENSDPNLPLAAVSRSHPASSSNIHTSGDPPDVEMALLPRMDWGDASHEPIPPVGVQNASHADAMLD
ncbi:hypothetical protein V6N11_050979 [Hibiscus sabdariffa]|uniref:DUF4283 domain-containing protein n=1 Tax=Hibiscus sabdariffa TaxID=183260 RepID=A0ABR2R320_9ROSI